MESMEWVIWLTMKGPLSMSRRRRSNVLPKIIHLIHLHEGLVFPIDRLVPEHACGGNHVLRHSYVFLVLLHGILIVYVSLTISNKEKNILRLAYSVRLWDSPLCEGFGTVIV